MTTIPYRKERVIGNDNIAYDIYIVDLPNGSELQIEAKVANFFGDPDKFIQTEINSALKALG